MLVVLEVCQEECQEECQVECQVQVRDQVALELVQPLRKLTKFFFKTLPVIVYCSHAHRFKHFVYKKLKTE